MRRRLGLALLALGAGVALLVSGAFAGHWRVDIAVAAGVEQRGGTLRLMWRTSPSRSTLPSRRHLGRGCCSTRRARSCSPPFAIRTPASGASFRGRAKLHRLERWPHVHLRAEADVSLPYRRAGDRAELRRRVPPRRHPMLGSPVRHRAFMQEIVGADAAMRGTTKTISGVQVLGRYRLRIRLKRRAATSSRPDDAVLLPDLARDADPPDRRSAWIGAVLRHGPRPEPAHRPGTESLLPRWAHGQPRPHRLDDRARLRQTTPGDRAGRERLRTAVQLLGPRPSATSSTKYGLDRRGSSPTEILRRSRTSSSGSTSIGPRSRGSGRYRSRRRSTTPSMSRT